MNWLDSLKLNLPEWLELVFALPVLAAFVGFITSLAYGCTDLVVHWVPQGRLRSLLLFGNRSPSQIASDFEEFSRYVATLPFFVFVGLIILTIIGAILFLFIAAGVGLIAAVIGVLAGWPSWAIVITLLLIALLLKK